MMIDAAAYWPKTNKSYFFRGKHYVRYRMAGPEGAEELIAFEKGNWRGLKFDRNIDAAVTVKPDDAVYFFRADQYVTYSLTEDRALHDPQPISSRFPRLPSGFDRDFDTVVYWPPNGKMYFFKGNYYIRYNLENLAPEDGKLLISDHWRGLSFTDIDACVIGNRERAYFFKGDQYIIYSVKDDKAIAGPRPWAPHWPGLAAMLGGAEIVAPGDLSLKATDWVNIQSNTGLLGQIFFETAKSDLTANAQKELAKFAPYAAMFNDPARRYPIIFQTIGFADHRKFEGGNDQLSWNRAQAVLDRIGYVLDPVSGRPERFWPGEYQARAQGNGVDPRSAAYPKDETLLKPFRRVDIIGTPYTITRPPQPPNLPETSSQWKARLRWGMAIGSPFILGIEVIDVEIVNLSTGKMHKYEYSGESVSAGLPVAFTSGTGWVEFFTTNRIRLEDFAGKAAHSTIAALHPTDPSKLITSDELWLNGPSTRGVADPITLRWVETPTLSIDDFGAGISSSLGMLKY